MVVLGDEDGNGALLGHLGHHLLLRLGHVRRLSLHDHHQAIVLAFGEFDARRGFLKCLVKAHSKYKIWMTGHGLVQVDFRENKYFAFRTA